MDSGYSTYRREADNVISYIHDILCREFSEEEYKKFLAQVKESLEEYTNTVLLRIQRKINKEK